MSIHPCKLPCYNYVKIRKCKVNKVLLVVIHHSLYLLYVALLATKRTYVLLVKVKYATGSILYHFQHTELVYVINKLTCEYNTSLKFGSISKRYYIRTSCEIFEI